VRPLTPKVHACLTFHRFVNVDTLSSLQIIQPESHPNAFNQGPGTSGSKESLSVFGLFQYSAKTPQGRARLRQMFLRPSLDAGVINARLDFVSVFARPDKQPVTQKLSKSLSKIKNMRNIMTMLHKGVDGGNGRQGNFKGGVWSCLLEFCYHTIDVAEGLREVIGVENLPLCAQATEVLDRFQLQRVGKMVHDVVDLESSTEQHRTVVKRAVDENLDTIKDGYDGMEELLSQAALDITRTMPAEVDCSLNVIFFPQLGFHITVPLDERTGQAVWMGVGWEAMFTTEKQVYLKDPKMRALDQDLGDLWASICDIEIEIAHDLAQRVLMDEKLLVAASDLCGELDSLLALAHGAVDYNLTRPRIVNDNLIDIRGGRHLLQEMTVPSYVPNDAYLVGARDPNEPDTRDDMSTDDRPDGASMLMLTGPNYSGKSVYQKQVALIVYMAQLGCFVPAEACTMGITDKILTRITTRETVSKSQSAFMIDLQQVAIALNSCTRRSLVVIDEFGKGTDTCDGAGLAAGTFLHLLSLGNECSKVLAATHFHEIFELGLFENNPGVAFAHMEVHVDRKGKRKPGDHSSEVTYLYQLREGRSTVSYGAQCAAMNGIPDQIVARAAELAEHMSRGEDLVAICSDLSAQEIKDLEDAEAVSRAFLAQDFGGSLEGTDVMGTLDEILNAAASTYMTGTRSKIDERESGSDRTGS
jgi:DNA mismatch repair protein MSH5